MLSPTRSQPKTTPVTPDTVAEALVLNEPTHYLRYSERREMDFNRGNPKGKVDETYSVSIPRQTSLGFSAFDRPLLIAVVPQHSVPAAVDLKGKGLLGDDNVACMRHLLRIFPQLGDSDVQNKLAQGLQTVRVQNLVSDRTNAAFLYARESFSTLLSLAAGRNAPYRRSHVLILITDEEGSFHHVYDMKVEPIGYGSRKDMRAAVHHLSAFGFPRSVIATTLKTGLPTVSTILDRGPVTTPASPVLCELAVPEEQEGVAGIRRESSLDLAYIYGAFSGKTTSRKHVTSISFASRSGVVAAKVTKAALAVCDRDDGFVVSEGEINGIFYHTVHLRNPAVVRSFLGATQCNTHLPWNMLTTTPRQQRALCGLIDFRGSLGASGFMLNAITCRTLARDYAVLFYKCGFMPSVSLGEKSSIYLSDPEDLARLATGPCAFSDPEMRARAEAVAAARPQRGPINEKYREFLRRRRELKGLSYAKAAELLDIPKKTYEGWCKGSKPTRFVNRDQLRKLAAEVVR